VREKWMNIGWRLQRDTPSKPKGEARGASEVRRSPPSPSGRNSLELPPFCHLKLHMRPNFSLTPTYISPECQNLSSDHRPRTTYYFDSLHIHCLSPTATLLGPRSTTPVELAFTSSLC
jgi:hypothetical protein